MSKDQTSMSEELFKIDGKPSTLQALPLALQHVVAMVVGCVAPAIIISGVAGLSASDSVILIQALLKTAPRGIFQDSPKLSTQQLSASPEALSRYVTAGKSDQLTPCSFSNTQRPVAVSTFLIYATERSASPLTCSNLISPVTPA